MLTINYIFMGKGIYTVSLPDTTRIPAKDDIVTFGGDKKYRVSRYIWDMASGQVHCELVSANYQ